jgi:hypothetical protein
MMQRPPTAATTAEMRRHTRHIQGTGQLPDAVRFSVISSEIWQPCTAAEFDLEAMAGLHFAALDRLADYVTVPLS